MKTQTNIKYCELCANADITEAALYECRYSDLPQFICGSCYAELPTSCIHEEVDNPAHVCVTQLDYEPMENVPQ